MADETPPQFGHTVHSDHDQKQENIPRIHSHANIRLRYTAAQPMPPPPLLLPDTPCVQEQAFHDDAHEQKFRAEARLVRDGHRILDTDEGLHTEAAMRLLLALEPSSTIN
jgi:hypothetical protein